MEILVLDGKEFVKASKAAKELGYTPDYVGQLCRKGAVTARLVGRTWYVHKEGLSEHKHEKKRTSRVKAREQAKKTIEAHRQKTKKEPAGTPIHYEKDDTALIPETRKLNVVSGPTSESVQEFSEESPENETEELDREDMIQTPKNMYISDIRMINVASRDSKRVPLRPKKTPSRKVVDTQKVDIVRKSPPGQEAEAGAVAPVKPVSGGGLKMLFATPLDDTEADLKNKSTLTVDEADVENREVTRTTSSHREKRPSVFLHVTLVLFVCLGVVVSTATQLRILYTAGAAEPVTEQIGIALDDLPLR